MKYRKIRLGMAVLAAGCLLSGCENAMEDGTDFLRRGDYQGAIAVFEQVINGSGEERVTDLLKQGDFQGAVSLAERKLDEKRRKPEDLPEAYRGIGMAYYELEDYEAARSHLQKALEEGGAETPTIYHLIGTCSMYLGDYDGALTAFDQGTALPQEAVFSEGTEWEQQADYQAAIQEMLRNRIVCYEKKQEWDSVKAAVAEYAARYPEDAEAQKEAEFWATR